MAKFIVTLSIETDDARDKKTPTKRIIKEVVTGGLAGCRVGLTYIKRVRIRTVDFD